MNLGNPRGKHAGVGQPGGPAVCKTVTSVWEFKSLLPHVKNLDYIEAEYLDAIAVASARGDNDLAQELSVSLKEYRECYKFQCGSIDD